MNADVGAKIVDAAWRRYPYAFSDFYRRGRPLRREARPAPPSLNVLITSRCGLGCRCCLASSATDRPHDIPAARLEPLFRSVAGIPKGVLLGGEPFLHPEIDTILSHALATFTEEVEVFTNGRHVPKDMAALRRRLEGLCHTGRARLVLTLAVDAYHREAMGAEAFEACIAFFLEWKRAVWPGLGIRFNISDEAFAAERYLSRPLIEEAISRHSPALAAAFSSMANLNAIEDGFVFNPLLRQGRFRDHEHDAFSLRLTDLARGEDWTLAPDLADPAGQERIALFSSLNAAWAAPPPPACRLGHPEDGASLPELLRDDLGRRGLLPDSDAANDPLVTELVLAHRDPEAYWRQHAERLAAVAADTGELRLEAGRLTETRATPLPLLHALYSSLLVSHPEAMQRNMDAFCRTRRREMGEGSLPRLPVFVTPWQDGTARLPALTPLRLPLTSGHWETGLSEGPAATVHPQIGEVFIGPGASLEWCWPGLSPALAGDPDPVSPRAAWRFWFSSWRLLLGETLWAAIVPRFRAVLEDAFPAPAPEWRDGFDCTEEDPLRPVVEAMRRDPLVLFQCLGFLPALGEVPWRRRELLQRLLALEWPFGDPARVAAFREELRRRLAHRQECVS